jgi:CO/xanthine dehydrogenase Mo-binding subunit
VRFVGQRVVAVVAETEGAADEACRRVEIDYEILPAVFEPELAMREGAPVLHQKNILSRIMRPERNIALEIHGENGNVEQAFAMPTPSSRERSKRTASSTRNSKRTSLSAISPTMDGFTSEPAPKRHFRREPSSPILRNGSSKDPAGAFRGYGITQTCFAVESAMDELAR